MSYTYDILLNFHQDYYEFYDWNKEDKITHIRKIPLFKISTKQLNEIKTKKIKLNKHFLENICNKTEKFKHGEIIKLKHTVALSDSLETIAIQINKNGCVTLKSSLTIDENEDVSASSKFMNETNLEYEIIGKALYTPLKTRFEIKNQKFIKNELKKTYKEQNKEKLNYIYLECFDKNEKDIQKTYIALKKEVNKFNENFYKIFNFLQLTNKNNNSTLTS